MRDGVKNGVGWSKTAAYNSGMKLINWSRQFFLVLTRLQAFPWGSTARVLA